ncbi:hypothetical protein J2785_006707 [Burkholderia ambifaria]|nr:hypothetical protein [Burkholderia ambifaria]MDR6503514.1 hypothetical protein [Burkholderia ambifaria]
MFKNTLMAVALGTLLAGCASQNTHSAAYDPATDARIRVYFGASTHFFFNTTCEPKKGVLGFGGGGMAVAKPRTLHLANTTIGMPVPEDAYRYYDEYVIKANEPLTISVEYGGDSLPDFNGFIFRSPFQHIARTFVPQAGKDYEAFASNASNSLQLNVRRLSVVGEHVQTEPVSIKAAPKCQDVSPDPAG